MKRILVGFLLLVVLAALGAAGAGWWLLGREPARGGERTVAGISGPVEVWWDSLGVPQVWAETEEDMVFAQGYLHARDRLWQMELLRRVAEGRLAEVLGEELLEADRFLRTLGLARAAREQEARLDGRARRLLEAYAAGVNAWLAEGGPMPPEFVLLRHEPEPWRARHSLAIERVMAWDLSAYQASAELARAARLLGAERAAVLAPEYPEWGATILEPAPPEVPAAAAALLRAGSITRASNAWVVAGSRTRSGKPILANDMHLHLQAPAIWYLMALHARRPAYDVAGMTLPGAPFVVAGHNRAIAWGFTNAYLDDADLFVERPDPADPGRYLTPEGSAPFDVAAETILVKGRAEPVILDVRRTRHGPVLTPVEERAGGELLALRWVGHDPSNTFQALAALNRAAGWDDFAAAVEDFDNPHQNVVYADTAGRIGYWMGGRVPIRGDGRRPPLLPIPGWTGAWDWTGELSFAEHPHALDPPHGYVVTANNRQAAGEVADRISAQWEEPFRAERIREMILEAGGAGIPLDAEAVHRMQLDVRDARAARYRSRAVAAAERAGLAGEANLLRGWDLRATEDSRGAALFYAWFEYLRAGAARSLYGSPAGEPPAWFPRAALTGVLERGALPWVEEGGAAALEALEERSARAAAAAVRGRSWGELHRVAIEHPLGSVTWLERLLDLNLGPFPAPGSPTTVNVAHDEWPQAGGEARVAFPIVARGGASQRHVVDMADVDGAGGFVLPTGQSGRPRSGHYRDQLGRWREGGLWRIPLGRDPARARTVAVLRLLPAGR